jgi:hypothetical protein
MTTIKPWIIIPMLALWCLMLFANHHIKQTKEMFEPLPEVKAELEVMEGEITILMEEIRHGLQ